MITPEQLEALLATAPAARVKKEDIEARITGHTFHKLGETVTLCSIELDNGFSVRGESACVNPENYNQEIGEKLSYDQAFNKLWPLFGFLLAEAQYQRTKVQPGAYTVVDEGTTPAQ